MFFKKKAPSGRKAILQQVVKEVEKLLRELEHDGKDLSQVKYRKFQKTHHISCVCKKCTQAQAKNNPRLRGLREYGFKVYVEEHDEEKPGEEY